ncbi:MAG: tRNA dimethylallyltransferase [Kiritimatiellae bacterium]|nr:tRNA dimethylallyltransferase [Kiritimatiellia bacterium]
MHACFLVGPTAVGKTAVAQWIAEREGYDILSADSMLVYRGMDVGTAKPSAAERARVRYWCVDLVAPAERFSVARYRRAALEALRRVEAEGRQAIVVGGTGLYVKCLVHGLRPGPKPDARARAHWRNVLEQRGIGALQDALRGRDAGAWARLTESDRRNPRRLVRALERPAGPDAPPAPDWADAGGGPIAGLRMPGPELHARIGRRVDRMYRGGLLAEVRGLLANGFDAAATAGEAIGYAEAAAFLAGACTEAEAKARTAARTRRLAKRQLTWFRHQADVCWIDANERTPVPALARRVLQSWRTHGPTPIVD